MQHSDESIGDYKLLADPELTNDKTTLMAKSDKTADCGTKDLSGGYGGTTTKLHTPR